MRDMQINLAPRGKGALAYDPMRWLLAFVVGKIHGQVKDDFFCDCSIVEREKDLLAREGKRLFRLGLAHDEIYEQLTLINTMFFIQPLSDKEVLLICASVV